MACTWLTHENTSDPAQTVLKDSKDPWRVGVTRTGPLVLGCLVSLAVSMAPLLGQRPHSPSVRLPLWTRSWLTRFR